jgi:Tat protein secretion system quality control protein TatD with DNase activity
VLLLGEIGLDYYWKPYDAKLQADVFVQQMEIAAAARKPISIHTRDAWDDTIALLREHWARTALPCIMHCFTGDPEQARQALDLGFYLSFSGVVTYPRRLMCMHRPSSPLWIASWWRRMRHTLRLFLSWQAERAVVPRAHCRSNR